MSMDRERVRQCLEVVAAYRASGQKCKAWAQAHGVHERTLASWCAHARRWQARLDGVKTPSPQTKPKGFVAARVASASAWAGASANASANVRIEVHSGAARLDLHWPLGHTSELAALVRELAR